ncbi:MAG: hypothetical protein QF473_00525 [Planctomycetota bacterium]|jgi:hypothetical protein|nr:hypothetical protein [Planctomycetota bacterium]
MSTQGNISSVPMPPDADVEVSVKIHTPLHITKSVARQKANSQLVLNCGQSFATEEPEIQVGERVLWRIPIWVTHQERGKVAHIGELKIDAQTGEVLATSEQFQHLKAAANGVLDSLR